MAKSTLNNYRAALLCLFTDNNFAATTLTNNCSTVFNLFRDYNQATSTEHPPNMISR